MDFEQKIEQVYSTKEIDNDFLEEVLDKARLLNAYEKATGINVYDFLISSLKQDFPKG